MINTQNGIIDQLKEKLKNKNIKFYKVFLPKKRGLKDSKNTNDEYPFVLIRPFKSLKKDTFKMDSFEMILGIENNDIESGEKELFDFAKEIISIFEENSCVQGRYNIDLNSIEEEFKADEYCVGDYWHYTIKLDTFAYEKESKILERMGF